MKGLKRTLSFFSLLGLLAFSPAYAQVTVANDTTGADSVNEAEVTIENEIDIDVNNTQNINSTIDFQLSTGNNEASYNTGNGSVESGDISTEVSLANVTTIPDIPEILTDIDDLEIIMKNSHTGAGSDNDTQVKVKNEYKVDIDNHSDITNLCQMDMDTGNNEADYNTGDGSVMSGGIKVNCTISNEIDPGGGSITPVTPDGGGQGGGVFPSITPTNNGGGMGGGGLQLPSVLPRAGQGAIDLIAISLLTLGVTLGLKKFAFKKFVE